MSESFIKEYIAYRKREGHQRKSKRSIAPYQGPAIDPIFEVFPTSTQVSLEKVFGKKDTTVCIVGNGPSILKDKLGKLIDLHDYVFRLNDFKTTGLTPYTGEKITHWITGCGIQQPKRVMGKKVKTLSWSYQPVSLRKRIRRKTNGRNVFVLRDKRALLTLGRKFNAGVGPSLGFCAIGLALKYYSYPPSIVGFDSNDGKNKSTIDHYTGKVTRVGPRHNFAKEKQAIAKWVKRGKVIRLGDPKSMTLLLERFKPSEDVSIEKKK